MLVLTRKPSESLVANGPCKVTLIDIGRGKVRLGIDANESVRVLRTELIDAKRPMPPPAGADLAAACRDLLDAPEHDSHSRAIRYLNLRAALAAWDKLNSTEAP